MDNNDDDQIVIQCYHCDNKSPHSISYRHTTKMLYEQLDDEKYFEDYEFIACICSTCGGLSLFGDFTKYPHNQNFSNKRLYPLGPSIIPSKHMLHDENPSLNKVLRIYDEI